MLIAISRAERVRHAMSAVVAAVLFMPLAGVAYDGPVEKKVFTLPSYTTVGGKTLKDVRVGYETYGKLNAAGDNAIFVPHFFSATSHAAGKYTPADAAAGYWDPIIGAGRGACRHAGAIRKRASHGAWRFRLFPTVTPCACTRRWSTASA